MDESQVQNKDVDFRKRKLEECTDLRIIRVLDVEEHEKKTNQSVELIKRFENEFIHSKINVERI